MLFSASYLHAALFTLIVIIDAKLVCFTEGLAFFKNWSEILSFSKLESVSKHCCLVTLMSGDFSEAVTLVSYALLSSILFSASSWHAALFTLIKIIDPKLVRFTKALAFFGNRSENWSFSRYDSVSKDSFLEHLGSSLCSEKYWSIFARASLCALLLNPPLLAHFYYDVLWIFVLSIE